MKRFALIFLAIAVSSGCKRDSSDNLDEGNIKSSPHVPAYFVEAMKAQEQKNYFRAVEIVTPPAFAGDPAAQYFLGDLYARGQGVPQNRHEAIKWIELSARSGNPTSFFRLAGLYAGAATNGGDPSIPDANIRALMWMNLAAASGDNQAATLRDQLKSVSSQRDVLVAENLASKCLQNRFVGCGEL